MHNTHSIPDRMELQALLAEPTLLNTYFLVYFNFKGTYGRERDAQEEYVRMTRDKLELSQSIHRLIFVHRFVDLDNLLVDLCRKLDR